MTNPTEILDSLTSQQLRDRIDQLERERRAMMVLLRAVVAKEGREASDTQKSEAAK